MWIGLTRSLWSEFLDRSDQQFLGANRALCQFGSTRSYGPNFWIVLITGHSRQSIPSPLESSRKISKRTRPGSPEPAAQALPGNPLAAVQRKRRSQRTQTTREIAFAAGRSAARDEFHERVTTLEAQVQTLQAELASAQTELLHTQETLAATRSQLAVAQLLQAAPRPTVASGSPYLHQVPRKQT